MRTCGGNTARQPVSSDCALRCDSESICANTLFTLAQRPRSDFRRTKKRLCLTGNASHQPYPGLQGQHPPGLNTHQSP
jgi:hypothetical protein